MTGQTGAKSETQVKSQKGKIRKREKRMRVTVLLGFISDKQLSGKVVAARDCDSLLGKSDVLNGIPC